MIRCDASERIGLGHLTRCSALAAALYLRGVRCVFVMKDLSRRFIPPLSRQFELATVPENTARSSHGLLTSADAHFLADRSRSVRASGVLVDHYGASPDYFRTLTETGLRVAVIDDLADRDLHAVSWVLNQNLAGPEKPYKLAPRAAKLMGPKYALVRTQFAEARAKTPRRFSRQDNRVLITLGGGDNVALYGRVVKSMEEIDRPLQMRVLLNASVTEIQKLRRLVRTSHHRIEWLPYTARVASQMAWADVAVCAAGSTVLEMLCMGLPLVSLCLSVNQGPNARGLRQHGWGKVLSSQSLDQLPQKIESLLSDPVDRARMSRRQKQAIDGRGAMRAAQSLSQWLRYSHS